MKTKKQGLVPGLYANKDGGRVAMLLSVCGAPARVYHREVLPWAKRSGDMPEKRFRCLYPFRVIGCEVQKSTKDETAEEQVENTACEPERERRARIFVEDTHPPKVWARPPARHENHLHIFDLVGKQPGNFAWVYSGIRDASPEPKELYCGDDHGGADLESLHKNRQPIGQGASASRGAIHGDRGCTWDK